MEEILYTSARISWYGLGFSVCKGLITNAFCPLRCISSLATIHETTLMTTDSELVEIAGKADLTGNPLSPGGRGLG